MHICRFYRFLRGLCISTDKEGYLLISHMVRWTFIVQIDDRFLLVLAEIRDPVHIIGKLSHASDSR